ncbi:DNA topoisomerase-3 [Stigmatella aurantiaca]|uniref:ATP-dependent DNA helicase RecQ n=2 Tax=Stigmatella aurantiaca TaxID=41 RepID=A0A1H7XM40_STIAU|nr:DNA topoisomerase-3 [Stigmatella aurantiaca]
MRWDEMGTAPEWETSRQDGGGRAARGGPSVLAVVAEKPAVARDIARALGASQRGEGCFRGNGYVVTWAIGHLVGLAQPHEIQPAWKRWHREQLPMLPSEWPLVVSQNTRTQFEVVRAVVNAPEVSGVVCATDAGREGELIFRYIYEAAGCRKPVKRLWVSSLTEGAIREGFRQLKEGRAYDALADAAKGRSRADWLVGMNLSRLYTLAYGETLSVGRVQTPTLAMLVERELAIRDFVPEDYLEVVATFAPQAPGVPAGTQYRGTWFREADPKAGPRTAETVRQARRLAADGVEAGEVMARVRAGTAAIESLTSETKRMAPPLLYDLTELQRHANRLYGFSAQRTLELAQNLYEKHKLLSYPRTASRHLSASVAETLPEVVRAIRAPYEPLLAPGTGEKPLGRRFVDDGKVTDHHAIIPTATSPEGERLPPDERRIYELVCRRLLAAWHDEHVWAVTTVVTAVSSAGPSPGAPKVDRFHSSGTQVVREGWKVLDIGGGQRPPKGREGKGAKEDGEGKEPEDEPQDLPAVLAKGQKQRVEDVEAVKKRTRPPPRLTDASLLTAMETAGRALDEKELADAMKETGLGTPATRAAIIEVLLEREYLQRRGKSLEATEKGIRLIQMVHPDVKTPAMTGQWEAWLQRIERGQGDLPDFLRSIEAYVIEVVGKVPMPPSPPRGEAPRPAAPGGGSAPAAPRSPLPVSRQAGPAPSAPAAPRLRQEAAPAASRRTLERKVRAPTPPGELRKLLKEAFGFEDFRPYQEEVCRAATAGEDLLLVMPTGAGKSLCYQLPGLARAGTTLVVSPLIALMEDQVTRLQSLGFAAERIHSGRDRATSRQVCADYLEGKLDFLFIAPERLGVPGFGELLARRPPSLIAIDEAHCISQWGHDFRPDYRLLGTRLPMLRPAPVVALTATATPDVQRDIVQQLGLKGTRGGTSRTFIHGFRRTNIAIEVRELNPGQRGDAIREVLAEEDNRPAIVYASTRKHAEQLAELLASEVPTAVYHAGMSPPDRDRVQSAFLEGRLEVIVATTAFGMGIDKADVRTVFHAALPASLEGYYQEMGRAGRDGKPSRAVLLHSYVDRRTHEFFHQRDYPEPSVLAKLFHAAGAELEPKEALQARVRMDPEVFDKALEQLWIHGGLVMTPDERVRRGRPEWPAPYTAQRERKMLHLEQMGRYAEASGCRMRHLVSHFGDVQDSGKPCGLCDVCAPETCVTLRFAEPGERELHALGRILDALHERDGQATGRLHRELFGESLPRREFERLVGGMVRAGLTRLSEDSFEKDGKSISFQRLTLTPDGQRTRVIEPNLVLLPIPLEPKAAKKRRLSRGKAAGGRPEKRRKGPWGSAQGREDTPRRAAEGRTRAAEAPSPRALAVVPDWEGGASEEDWEEARDIGVRRGRGGRAAPPTPSAALVEALKAWRLAEARKRGVPAFRILTDRVLGVIASLRPDDREALMAIPGVGPKLVERYGAQLLALVSR